MSSAYGYVSKKYVKWGSAVNKIWPAAIGLSLLAAMLTGRSGSASQALLESGNAAVTLTITLLGTMTLWSGLMEILTETGDVRRIGLMLRRLLRPLFPGLDDDACWEAMSLNLSANVLGLGNAATPAGIRAAQLLAAHGQPGLRALAMLLALNNSSLQLMPTTVIALRAAAGSAHPAGIWPACLVSSAAATVTAALLMAWRNRRSAKHG